MFRRFYETPRRAVAFVIAAAAVLALPARAPGGTVPYRGAAPVEVASPVQLAAVDGDVIARRVVPFLLLDIRFDARYDLTLENLVVREPATGTLDFYYRVTNESDRPLRLVDVDTGRFTRPGSFDLIDVGVRGDAPGSVGPVTADRGNSHFDGVVLSFPFFEELAPGEATRMFYIRTTATQYGLDGLTQFRSTPGVSATDGNGFALTFGPVLDGPVVPPPSEPIAMPLPSGAFACIALALFAEVCRRCSACRH